MTKPETKKFPSAMGVCDICLEATAERHGNVVRCYCGHTKSGATMVMRDGQPTYWTIVTPVSSECFYEQTSDAVSMINGLQDTEDKKQSIN